MRHVFRAFQGWNLAISVVCVALFVTALVSGQGIRSFAFVVAAVWWAALGIYWGRRSRKSQRLGAASRTATRRKHADGGEGLP